jgi:DNA polymerase/3'-5' exonuclease PolX
MIFPRRTALEAAATVEQAIGPLVSKLSPSGDLRMQKSTLSRIEYVIARTDQEKVTAAMAAAGWRKLRAGRGPLVFAREGFPKAVICTALQERSDLLGITRPSNFEVLLFLRTGTQIFLRGILAHIRESGFLLKPEQGLFHGDTLIAWTESDIFTGCGLDFVPPNERYHFRPENYRRAALF